MMSLCSKTVLVSMLESIVRYLIIDASIYKYLCERIRISVLAKSCSTIEYTIVHDLWDISILGKTTLFTASNRYCICSHRRGSGNVWVLDNDTLDTYSIKSWH